MEEIECAIIGAGIVGLAIARAVALSGMEVIVAEREDMPGSITSARNSGVIHAGIYYPAGSAKARLCVRGRALLYAYAADKNIPHRNCGKMIVAVEDADITTLQNIKAKAEANGVHDLSWVDAETAQAMEPELACVGGLLSPSTGIIDVHALIDALRVDIETHGGMIALRNPINRVTIDSDGTFILHLPDGAVRAHRLVNAAGLGAQDLARTIDRLNPATIPPQYLAKGNYFSVSGAAPFKRLIYPVPVPGGLGAHFTMNMAGESLFGPDVEWLEQQDMRQINYDVDPARADSFRQSIARYWPGIARRTLNPAYSGVRPKIARPPMPDGDFIVQTSTEHGIRNLVNLYGIESPGLTSALAIAEDVVESLIGVGPIRELQPAQRQ